MVGLRAADSQTDQEVGLCFLSWKWISKVPSIPEEIGGLLRSLMGGGDKK